MAIGATAGALNTMASSVSDRTVEIASVRVLGFSRLSAFLGTWVEAVMLAGLGSILGLVASWLVFNGWQASTVGVNNASMVFELTVTSDILLTAGLLDLAIGVLGGLFPAMAATRLPLSAALRARGRTRARSSNRFWLTGAVVVTSEDLSIDSTLFFSATACHVYEHTSIDSACFGMDLPDGLLQLNLP